MSAQDEPESLSGDCARERYGSFPFPWRKAATALLVEFLPELRSGKQKDRLFFVAYAKVRRTGAPIN
jgi:hypothetical protein